MYVSHTAAPTVTFTGANGTAPYTIYFIPLTVAHKKRLPQSVTQQP